MICKLQDVFTATAQNSEHAYHQQKRHYDRNLNFTPYQEGDLVWLHDPTTVRQKLAPHWKGPFEIVECLESERNVGVTYKTIFWISNCSLQPTETILGTSSLKTAANYSLCFVSFLILDRSIRCVTFQITTFCTPNFMSEDQILPQAPLPFQVPSSSVDPVNVMSTPNQSSSSVPVACLGWHPVKIPGYLRDYLLT